MIRIDTTYAVLSSAQGHNLVTIWLVISIIMIGERPMVLVDEKVPSISSCTEETNRVLEQALRVRGDDGFELGVTCSIVKEKETPATLEE